MPKTDEAAELLLRCMAAAPPPHAPAEIASVWDVLAAVSRPAGLERLPPIPITAGADADLVGAGIDAIGGHAALLTRPRAPSLVLQPSVRFSDWHTDGGAEHLVLSSFVSVGVLASVSDLPAAAPVVSAWCALLSAVVGASPAGASTPAWERDAYAGSTIRLLADDVEYADISLYWAANDGALVAVDCGASLERLLAVRVGAVPARAQLLGPMADHGVAPRDLDALRTASLLVSGGLRPSHRGAGYAVRRCLHRIESDAVLSGVGAIVRPYLAYWSMFCRPMPEWAPVARIIEDDLWRARVRRPPPAPPRR